MHRHHVPLSLVLVLTAACGDDGGHPATQTDAGANVGDADGGSIQDGGLDGTSDRDADGGGEEVGTQVPDFEPAATTDMAEWLELEAEWQVGATDPDRDDGTYGVLEEGRFRWPEVNVGAFGVRWAPAEFDEAGALLNSHNGVQYVVGRFTVDQATTVIAQADRAYRVWLDGRRRPGDIYGGVGVRLAYPVEAGEHIIAVQSEGRRGAPNVRIWTTDDEITLATSDTTSPHLIAGSDHVQHLGIAALVTTETPLSPVRFRVMESDLVEESVLVTPGLGPGATTQVPFELVPKDVWPSEGPVSVTLQIEAPQLGASYQQTVDIEVVEPGTTYRRTRLSGVDHSVQYAGIATPTGPEPEAGYGMILSLHGASVQGLGQARSYARKEWTYIVAPTNRRPFGFDWEVWGRLDALEALEDAKSFFGHDPTRVHVTGHSMGGHGTWQMGSLFPTLFATVGPSAGWNSFYSYGGDNPPSGVFARSQASSLTSNYGPNNLVNRAVYVIHGDADDNVPVRESRDWVALLEPIVEDLTYHEQPGAGHWWNVDPEPGADCVDWPGLFEVMEDRRLDPVELDFDFVSPMPWVSPRHSFVSVDAVESPMSDFRVRSSVEGSVVSVTTENVLRATLDGAALAERGVSEVIFDGESLVVEDSEMVVGEASAKGGAMAGPRIAEAAESPISPPP